MLGKVIGTVAKTVTDPKVKAVIDVVFYTSSALKMGTELARDWARDYEIRVKTDEKLERIVKDEVHDMLTERREELLADIMTDKEKKFLKSLEKNMEKAS